MATAESLNEEGIRLHRAGKHAEALAAFDAACRAEPHDPKLWFNRGNVLFMTGAYPQALESFSETLRLDGLLAAAWMMGAGCHAELGVFDEALRWIDKALALQPSNAPWWSNRGHIFNLAGRFQEGLASCEKALGLDASLADAWNNKGLSLEGLGKVEDACRAWARALELAPGHERAKRNRARGVAKVRAMHGEGPAASEPVSGHEPAQAAPSAPARAPRTEGTNSAAAHDSSAILYEGQAPAPASPAASFKRGDVIGQKYEVLDIVGEGGFGVVYRVRSRSPEAVYALKTIREELLADAKVREMFLREAHLWTELERHPYLVRAFFVDELHGRYYIAMEYVAPGVDRPHGLDGWLRSRPIPLETALRWAVEVCHGMEHAASRGVRCHRDLKPANILIAGDGSVRITDFGLSGLLGASAALAGGVMQVFGSAAAMTAAGAGGAGTATHMPPEQFRDAAACDARADVYAFGVILHQLACAGKLPYLAAAPKDGSREEGRRFWREMESLHRSAAVPRLDSPLGPVIERCLQKDPAARYPGFAAARAELEALLAKTGAPPVVPPSPKALEGWEWNNKGVSLNDLGRPEQALACFKKALELEPRDARAASNMALSLSALRRHEEALEWAQRALERDPKELSAWLNKAAALAGLGRHEEAVKVLDEAAKLDGGSVSVLNNKARSLMALRRFEEANTCLMMAIVLDGNVPMAWNNRGVCLDKLGRADEAADCYREALKLDPFQHMAEMNLGVILKNQGKLDEARRRYEKALELKPDYPNGWFNLAMLEDKAGRLGKARACYERFLSLQPGPDLADHAAHARARLLALPPEEAPARPADPEAPLGTPEARAALEQGMQLLMAGRAQEAFPLIQRAVELDHSYWPAWVCLGDTADALGRKEEARSFFSRATQVAPDKGAVWVKLGDFLCGQDELEEALRCYDKAGALDASITYLWNNRGAVLNRLERPEEALASFEKATAVDPKNGPAWMNKGHTLARLGRKEEAVAALKRAVLLLPQGMSDEAQEARDKIRMLEHGRVTEEQLREWLERATILRNQKKPQRALRCLDDLIDAAPERLEAWLLKAECLDELRRYDEAARCFARVLAARPGDAELHFKRGSCLHRLKRAEEAAEAFTRAVEAEPGMAKAWNAKGAALLSLGRVDEAEALVDKALALEPMHPVARFNKACILDKRGKREEAVRCYRQFLAAAPIQYKPLMDHARSRLKALEGS